MTFQIEYITEIFSMSWFICSECFLLDSPELVSSAANQLLVQSMDASAFTLYLLKMFLHLFSPSSLPDTREVQRSSLSARALQKMCCLFIVCLFWSVIRDVAPKKTVWDFQPYRMSVCSLEIWSRSPVGSPARQQRRCPGVTGSAWRTVGSWVYPACRTQMQCKTYHLYHLI